MRGNQTNKIGHALSENEESQDEDLPVTPLTAEQARELRQRLAQVSPWAIVAGQVGIGVLAACIAGLWFASVAVAWSVAYGALAVAVPAGLFARALRRGAGSAVLLWEWVKLGLTVALLLAAPRLVPGLNWLALLAGVILATKMYWVALAWSRRARRTGN